MYKELKNASRVKKPEDQWSCSSPATIYSEQAYGSMFQDWNIGMLAGTIWKTFGHCILQKLAVKFSWFCTSFIVFTHMYSLEWNLADFIQVLLFLHICIAPRQGQAIFWGQNFNVNRKSESFCPFDVKLTKKKQQINFCQNICHRRAINVNFHFPNYKSMATWSCHSKLFLIGRKIKLFVP